jgi:hypothetical protein
MRLALVRSLAFRYAIGLAVGAAFAAVWAVMYRAGFALAWVIFAPALLVLYALGEWAFQPVFSAEAGGAISGKRFSVLRIGIALLLMLPYIVVLFAVGWAMQGNTL